MSGQLDETYYFQILDANWGGVYNCGWQCDNPTTVSGLAAGDYRVYIKDSGYQTICERVITLTVGGIDPDADGDGIPASQDCDDNDANLTIVGATCDDGDPDTTNDQVQSNCTCQGATMTTGGTTVSCGGNTTITYGDGFITMAGQPDQAYYFQIFDKGWSEIYNCGWQCGYTKTVTGLSDGDYRVFIKDDAYQIVCERVITLINLGGDPDADGDGTPASQDCNDNDANLTIVGASCDDGNTNTTNDVVDANCTCVGRPINDSDADGDGIPASQDCNDNDANLTIVGASCDDGNTNTTNDVVDANCTCVGRPINDSDADGDGIPASQDCNDNDANLTIVGASCDDGNTNTTNDTVDANCTCVGTTNPPGGSTTVSCDGNTTITYGDGAITMSGPSGEEYYFQIFDLGWNEVYNCGWQCGNPLTVTGLSAGDYRVFIKDNGYQVICDKVITLTNGGNDPDDDGDGVLASQDCDDNDPNLTTIGASCDDGNVDTTNDLVLANCTCMGTTIPTGGTTISCGGNTTITYGEGAITMSGPSGEEYYFQVFDLGWNEVYNCGWQCDNPTSVIGLPAGDYRVFIKDDAYQIICETVITLTAPPSFLIIEGSNQPIESVESSNEKKGFTLYPNPTFDEFTVNFDSRIEEEYTVIISDIVGREHFHSQIIPTTNTTKLTVDCNSWRAGVYFVRLINDHQKMKVKRIVIAKE